MAKVTRGWKPTTFSDVLAKLDSESMRIALQAGQTRTCPAPPWDTDRTYRVTLAAGQPQIQRYKNNQWEPAPLEPVEPSYPAYPPHPGEVEEASRAATTTALFISHSSKDVELATALTRLIEPCLAMPERSLRCTSVPGYTLEAGINVASALHSNLKSSQVVLGLLTENGIESSYVLMELGAAWGLERHVIPLAIGATNRKVAGPIGSHLHVVDLTDEAAVAGMLESIADRCGWGWRGDTARRHTAVKDFVEVVRATGRPQKKRSDDSAGQQLDPAAIQEGIAFLSDYIEHLVALSTANSDLKDLQHATRQGHPIAPEALETARHLIKARAIWIEENILRAHDLVELATGRTPDWSGPQLRAGLDMSAVASLRAALGRLREWAKASRT